MYDDHDDDEQRLTIDRREALRRLGLAVGGVGAIGGGAAIWRSIGRSEPATIAESEMTLAVRRRSAGTTPITTSVPPSTTSTTSTTAAPTASSSPSTRPSAAYADRLLVIVELAGGMDGMSLVPPAGVGTYYDLRPTTAINPFDTLDLKSSIALHPKLKKLHRRQFAVLQGVGARKPDESHFEMMRRWHAGDPDGTVVPETGIWGRIADAIGDPEAPATAMTVGAGPHPAIRSARVPTISLSGPDQAAYFAGDDGDPLRHAFRTGIGGLQIGARPATSAIDRLRAANRQAGELAERLDRLSDARESDGGEIVYPGTRLGQSLRFAAKLLHGDLGTRIVHVPMNEDFDTHQYHNVRFDLLMTNLDDALDAFLTDLDARGLSDRVVVATVSEFGRRPGENYSGGLDHGTANNLLLFGQVQPGLHGEYPSLSALDFGNLRPTCTFEEYYAALAGDWLGADVNDVIPGATPLAGLIA